MTYKKRKKRKKKYLKGQPLYFSLTSVTTPCRVQGIWLLTDWGCQREFLPAGRVQAAPAQPEMNCTAGAARVGRQQNLRRQSRLFARKGWSFLEYLGLEGTHKDHQCSSWPCPEGWIFLFTPRTPAKFTKFSMKFKQIMSLTFSYHPSQKKWNVKKVLGLCSQIKQMW